MAGIQDVAVPRTNDEREILKWRNGLKQLIEQLGSVEFGSTYINGNIFTIDFDDTGGNVDVVFGKTVNKHLRHTGTQFQFDDDLLIDSDITIAAGSITSAGAAISFGAENLSTTGTLAAGISTIDTTLILASGSITDSGGAISFGNENLSTSGNLTLSGLTQNSVLFAGAGGIISEDTTYFLWDNGNLTLDVFKFEGLQIVTAKVNEVAGITKGQTVYISGATGDKPQISLGDNTAHEKAHILGVAAETKADGQNIDIAVWGELIDVDTSGFTAVGDRMHLSTAGAMTSAPPVSGAHVHLGFVTKKDAVNGIMFLAPEPYSHDIRGTTDTDVMLATGDDASTYKIIFDNYSGTPLGNIQGDGRFTWLSDIYIATDDVSLKFGAAQSAEITWDSGSLNLEITGSDLSLISQSLILESTVDTDKTTGIIYKGAAPWIHDYHDTTGGGAIPVGKNIFIGESAGNFTMGSTATQTYHTSGNVGIGYLALTVNTLGYDNFALGNHVLQNNTAGDNNVGIGSSALDNNTIGAANLGIGAESLRLNTIGSSNVGIGSSSVSENTEGDYNIGIGVLALTKNTTGDYNIGIGYRAGRKDSGGVNNTTGSRSIFMGDDARANANGETNQIVIGDTAVGIGSNTAVLGNDSITDTRLKGNVFGDKFKLTLIGGLAIKLTNKTGGNTVAGQLVISSTGTTDAFATSGVSADDTIGIILDAGVADGSEAWIVISGIADVLIDAGGSTIGDRMISSATAGSADVWNVGGAVATHFLEIGHCIETRVGAGLARCVLHFN